MNLPALREELVVQEGPRSHNGQPSWTLHDPCRNRFFRLDWLTFEILQRWSLGEPELIASTIGQQTPLHAESDDVMDVLKFVGANQLLKLAGAHMSAAMAESKARSHPSWWQWLIHNYLFFRVPVIRPAKLLESLHAQLGFLFGRTFWHLTVGALFIGLTLVWRQWDVFQNSWSDLASAHGLLGSAAVLVLVKIIHEFGHGLASTHYGCRVPSMGIAFLVMAPVAYTDTNEAWNLKERRPRLVIGAAGMLAELTLAAWSTLAWGLLPDGYWRSAAFTFAAVTWIKSVLVNTSPLMRFDGYYLLSDFLDLPNLHTRAFGLARWRMREWLFGLGETPPEHFRKNLSNGLVGLAVFIWIYRLVLFLGIAVFVYHYFFKALGILLFAVEITWFVALPIVSEVKQWIRRRQAIRHSPKLPWLGLTLLALVALVCVPLPQRVRLPGQLSAQQEFSIVTPEAGQLTSFSLRDGQTVPAGTPLLQIHSSAVQLRLAKARSREASLASELLTAESTPQYRARVPILQAELSAARAARRDAELAARELEPKAPFAGTFRIHDIELHEGEHVGKNEEIAVLVGSGPGTVVAYLDEQESHLVREGASARIYLDGPDGHAMPLKVMSIERDASRVLAHPMLTTAAGGAIQARGTENGWVPEHSIYRVELAPVEGSLKTAAQVRRGTVVIAAGSEAIISRWAKNALSVLWRELGV